MFVHWTKGKASKNGTTSILPGRLCNSHVQFINDGYRLWCTKCIYCVLYAAGASPSPMAYVTPSRSYNLLVCHASLTVHVQKFLQDSGA